MKMRNLINEKIYNKIDYPSYLRTYDKDIRFKESDINVFIPKTGRDKHFKSCVTSLIAAKNECKDTNINIILIEDGDSPTKLENRDYSIIFRRKESRFNKALSYNIGYLACPKAKWNVFHDVDVMVPEDFFIKLSAVTKNTDRSWIQPYREKRIIYLTEKLTNYVFSTSKPDYTLLINNGTPGHQGSPGGSIAVKSSEVDAVGGYDPELFYEYSVEDSFFWSKLEINNRHLHMMKQCHNEGAEYINTIELVHLWHPQNTNKMPDNGGAYLRCLWEEPYELKMRYIETAKDLLKLS